MSQLAGLWLVAGGCAAPPAASPLYPVGVYYGVETLIAQPGGLSDGMLEQDFTTIDKLGFNTVFVRHAEDQDVGRVVGAATRTNLAAAVSARRVLYYVRTGLLPEDCDSVEALVRSTRPKSPDVAGATLIRNMGTAVDKATASRVARLASAVASDKTGVRTVAVWAGPPDVDGALRSHLSWLARSPGSATGRPAGDMLLLECVDRQGTRPQRDGARWLADYHAGLAAGLTGGLVVDRFRVIPGQWRALAEGREPVSAERATAIRRVAARAALWGPKLRKLVPQDLEPLNPSGADPRIVLFAGPKRRFIMLFNSLETDFVHRKVNLPATLGGRPVKRVVAVPADDHVIGGEVVAARGPTLTIAADLAPGDASLWEVF